MDQSFIQAFIARQRAENFADFQGAIVHLTIPLTEDWLNELAQAALRQPSALQGIFLALRDQNRLGVHLTVKKWGFTKSFNLELNVEKSINFPDSPKLQLWLSPANLVWESILEVLVKMRGTPNPNIHISGRLIEVDLGAILQQKNLGQLVPLIKFAEIEVFEGRAFIHLRLEIDQNQME